MHANDVFLFFKNHFWHQHIKTIQKVQTALNFNKKKNSNLDKTQVQTQYQTFSKYQSMLFFSREGDIKNSCAIVWSKLALTT
jgi:hypothetical protein